MASRRSLVAFDASGAEQQCGEGVAALGPRLVALGNKLEEKQRSIPMLELPFVVREAEIRRIVNTAQELRANSDVLIVVATGGPYSAARGAVEAFAPDLGYDKPVVFVGHDLSPETFGRLAQSLGRKRVAAVAASLGSPPLELCAGFRLVRSFIKERHGEAESQRRIVLAVSESCQGWARLIGQGEHRVFKFSDRVSSQWCATAPSTLLALALAGVDANQYLEGARSLARGFDKTPLEDNECFLFASARMTLLESQLTEMLVYENNRFHWLAEWWKQLMNPSAAALGPPGGLSASVHGVQAPYTLADFRASERGVFFETHLRVASSNLDPGLAGSEPLGDGLDPFTGAPLAKLEQAWQEEVQQRGLQRALPTLRLEIPKLDPFSLGALCFFLETAAALAHKLGDIPLRHDVEGAVAPAQIGHPAET